MLLRANALAKGNSGARIETVELLIECLNRGVLPQVPARGSVGASGDLAPLAHLALPLVGEGARGSAASCSTVRRRSSAPGSNRCGSLRRKGCR
jgi:Histidine ammonia-lyase